MQIAVLCRNYRGVGRIGEKPLHRHVENPCFFRFKLARGGNPEVVTRWDLPASERLIFSCFFSAKIVYRRRLGGYQLQVLYFER